MHLEEFADGTTVLHKLDPRVKFITVGPMLVLTALAGGLIAPLYALVYSVVLALVARLDIKQLFIRLLAVNFFVLTLWVFLPFSTPGEVVLNIGQLTATREGLLYALSITLKTNAIVLATIAAFGTTGAMNLAHALVHMHAPQKLVHLFFFFYRYVSVLHEEYTRLRAAMRVRGFRPGMNTHTYRTLGNLIGMLLVRSHDRSVRIYEAMLVRGFHGHFPVVSHFHMHGYDYLTGAVLSAGALGVLLAGALV